MQGQARIIAVAVVVVALITVNIGGGGGEEEGEGEEAMVGRSEERRVGKECRN